MKGSGENWNSIKKRLPLLCTRTVLFTVYGILCTYLYYMQTMKFCGFIYESDLPYHIEMALDGWGYSLTAIVYRFLNLFPNMNFLVALFLMLCTLGAVLATEKGISLLLKKPWISFGIAFCSGFVMPFFIEAVQYSRYTGYQSGSIWHNSTYIVMKFLAVLAFILYCVLARKYGKKLTVKEWIAFAVLLALTTATKTSFVAVFAPAALLMLGVDLYLKVPWKKVLLVALTVVPTILIVLLQEAVLFGDDTGNGIAIEFAYNLYVAAKRPYFTVPLSVAFPLLVLGVNLYPVLRDTLKDLKKREQSLTHREFLFSWLMWGCGLLEYVFLRETGTRSNDGNFSWGYDFCVFVVFTVCMVYFVKNLKSLWEKNKKVPACLYGVFAGGVLLYHFYCGLYFFAHLMIGTTYFM